MPVNTQHPEYSHMADKWMRCRAVMQGQDAVHAAGPKFLPRLLEQAQEDYDAYVKRTPFYNATWRTISGLVGMLFRQAPKQEAPQQVLDMLDDVTLSGVPMQQLAQEVSTEALGMGRTGLLVDYPTVNTPGMTQADARQQNLRPIMQTYKTESCINWRTARVRNVHTLVQVVLKECELIPEDEFKSKSEERFRVLDLGGPSQTYRVRVFEHKNDKDILISEIFPTMGGAPLDFIPFLFIGPYGITPETDDPPLIDLVDLNLSHYRTSADLEHGAHFTALPTAWVAGHVPEKPGDKLYIGSTSAWIFQSKDARAEFLEFKGEGLGSLERLQSRKEQQMAILGARMLEPQKAAVETAESQQIHRKGEESQLAAAALSISLGLTKALEWFTRWAGAEAEVIYELNKDFFPAKMAPQELQALVSAWQQGAISDQTLFENLQQGEIISKETTLEDEQARIANKQQLMGGPAGGPAANEDDDEREEQQQRSARSSPQRA